MLDGEEVSGITPSLREGLAGGWEPQGLAANKNKCFQGPIPVGKGFIVTEDEAKGMLADETVDYAQVVRPYLTSDDIANAPNQEPSRWIIDFAQMQLERATQFRGALDIVRSGTSQARSRDRTS